MLRSEINVTRPHPIVPDANVPQRWWNTYFDPQTRQWMTLDTVRERYVPAQTFAQTTRDTVLSMREDHRPQFSNPGTLRRVLWGETL